MRHVQELFSLDNKVAVVSGGAGLIGEKLCEILAAAGADIIIVDNNVELASSTADRISRESGKQVVSKAIDITNESQVKQLAETVSECFDSCDILINAAHYKGGSFFNSLSEYPKKAWDNVLSVNLTGTFLMCREFGSRMYAGNGGVIVNISSTYGVVSADPRIYGNSGIASPVSYATTKCGIINMTRYLAVHWRPKVRANVLIPGGVENQQDPEFINNYCKRTPLDRMAQPEEYQGAILFMCSEASAYMTGAIVTVDGGWTAW